MIGLCHVQLLSERLLCGSGKNNREEISKLKNVFFERTVGNLKTLSLIFKNFYFITKNQ